MKQLVALFAAAVLAFGAAGVQAATHKAGAKPGHTHAAKKKPHKKAATKHAKAPAKAPAKAHRKA